MSRESKRELPNVHAHEMNASNAPAASTPRAGVTLAVANFRQGVKKRCYKMTNEAGMYVKTKRITTSCPTKKWTILLN